MKRIFIAIKISPAIQEKAEAWRSGFKTLPVRWILKENLHVTLIPPWDEENLEKIINKLEKIQGRLPAFEVRFHNITYCPDSHNPRLIWADGEVPASLVRLQKKITKLIGFQPLSREFKPHLTLARFRPEEYPRFPIKELNEEISWIEKVDSICLMESTLKPEGAMYEVLKTIKL